MTRTDWLPLLLLCLLCSLSPQAFAQAAGLPAGYTDSYLGTIPAEIMPPLCRVTGDVVEDGSGNLYFAGGKDHRLFRRALGGSFVSVHTFVSHITGLDAAGAILHVATNDGAIYEVDTLATPFLPVAIVTLPDKATDLLLDPATGDLLATCDEGLLRIALPGGSWTSFAPAAQLTSMTVQASGTVLATEHGPEQVLAIAPGGSVTPFFSGPAHVDGIALHPVTGNIYVCAGNSEILELDPTGTLLRTFASSLPFSQSRYQSPLTFSTDGTTLYYVLGGDYAVPVTLWGIAGFPPVSGVACTSCGDCDSSGIAGEILDSLAAARIAVALDSPSPTAHYCCDIDGSTVIDILDSLVLAQSAAGIAVPMSCP